MALTSTMYNFQIALANNDRGVYENLDLKVAMHPSESVPFMLTRVLAYCLEYEEGIAFSRGIASAEEPAIWKHADDGQVKLWIEVGNPDGDKLHRASKTGARVVVYTHRDPAILLDHLKGKRIHNGEQIAIYSFPRKFLEQLETHLDRRNTFNLSYSEGVLYLQAGKADLFTPVPEIRPL
jgi:uncharacterized protein YaeQ